MTERKMFELISERCRDGYLHLVVERYQPRGADDETQVCVSTPLLPPF